MKISIITVVKNGMPFLKTAIKSFELQNYNKKELIIVYSSSNDGTEEFLLRLKNRYKIIKKNTRSIYAALNSGIKNSTGDVIGILHSDDVFFKVTSSGDEYEITPYKILGGEFVQILDKNVGITQYCTPFNFRYFTCLRRIR